MNNLEIKIVKNPELRKYWMDHDPRSVIVNGKWVATAYPNRVATSRTKWVLSDASEKLICYVASICDIADAINKNVAQIPGILSEEDRANKIEKDEIEKQKRLKKEIIHLLAGQYRNQLFFTLKEMLALMGGADGTTPQPADLNPMTVRASASALIAKIEGKA